MLVNKLSTSVPLTHTCTVQLQDCIVLPPEVLTAEIKIAQTGRMKQNERERGKAKETEQNKKWCPPAADACQLGNARWKQSHMMAVSCGSWSGFWWCPVSGQPHSLPPRLMNLLLSLSSQSVTPDAENKIKWEPVNDNKVSLTWYARKGRRKMSCSIHTSLSTTSQE